MDFKTITNRQFKFSFQSAEYRQNKGLKKESVKKLPQSRLIFYLFFKLFSAISFYLKNPDFGISFLIVEA